MYVYVYMCIQYSLCMYVSCESSNVLEFRIMHPLDSILAQACVRSKCSLLNYVGSDRHNIFVCLHWSCSVDRLRLAMVHKSRHTHVAS